jgi:hypothetical protein
MAKLGKSKPKASREREGELVGRAEADVHPHTTQHSSTHTQSYVHNNDVVYSHSYYPHAIRELLPGYHSNGAFTLDVKSVLNENLGGILGGTQF